MRMPAQTSRRHRLPRARESLYGEPQDCSDDTAAGQCARPMHHPLPSRFRRLPVKRRAGVLPSQGDFDASRPDIAKHPGLLSPRTAGCAPASGASAGALGVANRVLNCLPVRYSPLVSGTLGEAARQSPALRQTSAAHTTSPSAHDLLGTVRTPSRWRPRCWVDARPLWWFGMVECREQGGDVDHASLRKSVLFDRFLTFGKISSGPSARCTDEGGSTDNAAARCRHAHGEQAACATVGKNAMTIYTKYCKHRFNPKNGCNTIQIGSPELYRKSGPGFMGGDPNLMVDPDESKSLLPGASGIAGIEITTPTGGRIGVSMEGGELSFESVTQERLPSLFLYCVAEEPAPSLEKAKSLDQGYDDWFQIKDIDLFIDMIQGEIHKQIMRCFGLPQGHGFGVLEVRGPVQYYGEGNESDLKERATITFLTDHGYFKFGGSSLLDPLVEDGARETKTNENGMLSYVQGQPLWDAFFKHSKYKSLSEYRVAWFPCQFRSRGRVSNFPVIETPLNLSENVAFLARTDLERIIVNISSLDPGSKGLPIF